SPSREAYASVPSAPYASIPPNPTRPKKPLWPYPAGAGGLFVVLGAAGGGFALYRARQLPVSLPVEPKYLPAQTKEVGTRLIEAPREPNEQVKKLYLASELGASFCGRGLGDPAHRAERLGSSSPQAAKELFFDKKALDETQQVLECGAV